MLFNSWSFLAFSALVFPLYFALPRRGQNLLLLVASYVFYGAWDWRFLGLLWVSTLVDYTVGLQLERATATRRRRALLALSLVSNLGMLGTFKYFDFFAHELTALLAAAGVEVDAVTLNVVLPVGISFYTFQTLSYSVDVFRGQTRAARSLLDFALFVAYFPQLVAGPIERASRLLPQLAAERAPSARQLREAAWLVSTGLFKKVVVADNVGAVVDRVFTLDEHSSGALVVIAVLCFTVQIYCDFSGYSDIARGLSKALGIELRKNFDLPYRALNPSDFWRRWHISLSQWLRDYLYIPLGGSRVSRWRTYRNLALTMLLGGLWHGAAWNFILWGAYHGALLAAHRLLVVDRGWRPDVLEGRLGRAVRWLGMLQLTVVGWFLFRVESADQARALAGAVLLRPLGYDPLLGEALFTLGFFAPMVIALEAWSGNVDDPESRPGGAFVWPLLLPALWVATYLLAAPTPGAFLYFQF